MKQLDLEIKALDEIVGQPIINTIKELLDNNELGKNILLYGGSGTGKSSVAKCLNISNIRYIDNGDVVNTLPLDNQADTIIYITEDYHLIPKEKRDLCMSFYFQPIPSKVIEDRLNKICEDANLPNMKKVNNILAYITTTNFKEPINEYKRLNEELQNSQNEELTIKEFKKRINEKYNQWLKKQKDYINFTKSILYNEEDIISNYENWINKEEYNSFILKLVQYVEEKTSVKFAKVLINDIEEITDFKGSYDFYLNYSKEVINIINNELSFKELSRKIGGN